MMPLLREVVGILNEMAIYLLLGFFLAGLLHVILQKRPGMLAPLAGPGAKPVFLAALIGTPMSLCSCSVLPTGVQLARNGARKGAVASFLITCPETDVVSVTLTYTLLGPFMAVFRWVAAMVTGISAGLVINLLDPRPRPAGPVVPGGTDRAAGAPAAEPSAAPSQQAAPPSCEDGSCAAVRQLRPRGWLAETLYYGFVELFDDLLLPLLLGITIGAVLTVLVPTSSLTRFAGDPVLSYAAMLLIGIPLYVCASASTPIAVGLIAGGISPGAALVFLLAGPATNAASILVLAKQFGRLIFGIYLSMIGLVAVAMGLLLDFIVKQGLLAAPDPLTRIAGESTLLAWLGTLVFLGLALWSLWRRRADRRFLAWLERRFGWRVRARSLAGAVLAIVLLGWLSSGLFSVKAGERAAVTRFGAVTAADLGPGLHYHWPAPIGRVHLAQVGTIRRVEIGFRTGPASGASASSGAVFAGSAQPGPTVAGRAAGGARGRKGAPSASLVTPGPQDEGVARPGQLATHGAPTESWMLTGDENIVDVQAVAQYQVQDSPQALRAFLFGLEDPDRLVRAAAVGALQQALGGRGIESILTEDRAAVERQVREDLMQPSLDAWGSGIRVVDFRLVSVHAPTPVHWAFRDIAGAVEDARNYENQAREYSERIVREAQGDSARGVFLAQGQAAERVRTAEGEADAFLDQSGEYRRAPGLTRSRLYFEKLDAVLPGMDLYIDLTSSRGPGPSIWIKRGPGYEGLPFSGDVAPASPGGGSRSVMRGGSTAPRSAGSGAAGTGGAQGELR